MPAKTKAADLEPGDVVMFRLVDRLDATDYTETGMEYTVAGVSRVLHLMGRVQANAGRLTVAYVHPDSPSAPDVTYVNWADVTHVLTPLE